MPSKISDKCRRCSKLSVKNAMPSLVGVAVTRHDEQGKGCWVTETCYKHRTYYSEFEP